MHHICQFAKGGVFAHQYTDFLNNICTVGTIGMTGGKPCALTALVDVPIAVDETETALVQELHLPIYHALCADVEWLLFGEEK